MPPCFDDQFLIRAQVMLPNRSAWNTQKLMQLCCWMAGSESNVLCVQVCSWHGKFLVIVVGVSMCVIPHTVPCTSVHCACGWGVRSRYQKLCIAGFPWAQRTVQNNSNVKSEPNNWPVKTLQYVLSTFEFFLWLLQWTDFFASHWQCSARVSAFNSAKYVHCKGPAKLSFLSSIPKKCHPDILV